MKKVAVLGSTGMAGHVVAAYLTEHGYDVYGASRSAENSPKSRAIDAADFTSLGRWLDEVRPDAVVNCIGVLQKQCDERHDIAVLLNSYLPQWLAHRFENSAVKVIHLSTDCVFSGKRGAYKEDDFRDGETIYDRSKALGEIINTKDLTFRMSIIGPDRRADGTGLFNWFMKQHGMVTGYTKAIWNGVTTIELSRAIDAAIRQNVAGLYHLVPPEPIDKYNLLKLFQAEFGRDDLTIEPYDGFAVDKSLVNTRTDFDFEISRYPKQIAGMKDWIAVHSSLYNGLL